MLPVFKELKTMLSDFGIDLSMYDEDKLWINRACIKGFNKNGEEVKVCRLVHTDDLQYTYKNYKKTPKNEDLITWEETYQMYKEQIDAQEKESLDVIKRVIKERPHHTRILNTSMGKDSMLTDHLLSKVTQKFERIFNNTTMDCADVYRQARNTKNLTIVTPRDGEGNQRSFYNLIERFGTPTRFGRWCCSYFKEEATRQHFSGNNHLLFFMGIRNEESHARKDYDYEYKNDLWTNRTWTGIFPIRKWTELELWLYTIHNNIPINSKYKKGYSRVGCHIACPYYSRSSWVLDKYWYPKAYNRYREFLKRDFIKNERWTRMNCTLEEYLLCWNGGKFREEPTEEVLREFMEHKGIQDIEMAKKYFNGKCIDCGGNVNKKDETAMNLKLFGRNIDKLKCKKCIKKEFGWSDEDWNKQIETFKSQNCALF